MLAIVNARLETVANGTIEKGNLLIKNGKIVSIGSNIDLPDCCRIIDAKGRRVTPGIIDAHSHVGLHEQGLGWEGNDVNERTDPVTPWCNAREGINIQNVAFEDFRKAGITCVGVYPGSANVIGGIALAIKCRGAVIDEAIVKDPIGMKAALGENPKRVYGERKKTPSTRMANAAVLRETLMKAKYYLERLNRGGGDAQGKDRVCEALLPVLKREIPLVVHCHRHDDIVTAVRICREFDIRYVLEHVTDGYLLVDFIKKEKIHCALGPLLSAGLKVENKNGSFRTPVLFERMGIPFCLTTDHPVIGGWNLLLTASIAIQWGLKPETALSAITLEAARHLGIEDRVGSLEPGKDADLVVWSDNPFELTAFADITIINGEIAYSREVE